MRLLHSNGTPGLGGGRPFFEGYAEHGQLLIIALEGPRAERDHRAPAPDGLGNPCVR
jgi:hypothetical protein